MKIRNVDSNNDWQFGKGQSDYLKDRNAIALDIKLRIQEFYQDCFFNLPEGIDWETRLGYKNQKELLDSDMYRVAINTEGVYAVYDFESFLDGRSYRCSFTVYHRYSDESIPINFNSEELWQIS